jgi:hypothetical protein
MQRAAQSPGAVFALGWAMAALFDPRRRVSFTDRQPQFDALVQLPLVADLEPLPRLLFYVAELQELASYHPDLAPFVTRLSAAALNEQPETADEPSTGDFAAAAQALNLAILELFADQPEPLDAYQLGLALSDMCWLPYLAKAGDANADGAPAAFIAIFARSQLAVLKTLLAGAGGQLPAGTPGLVGQSMDNWADWVDINSGKIKTPGGQWAGPADVVIKALHVQGWVWHSVLTSDPEVGVSPGTPAWIHAATAIARVARTVTLTVLRRFWWLVTIVLAALGGLLYLVISNLSGVSQVWTSLATVAAVAGGGGYSLTSGVSQAFNGVGYEIWTAAKQDAAAWNITWLPPVKSGPMARGKLAARGVAAPQVRNMDAK